MGSFLSVAERECEGVFTKNGVEFYGIFVEV